MQKMLQLGKWELLILHLTISFYISGPKIPESHIFGFKFIHFWFSGEICNQTNLRVPISNMTTIFSNYRPKIPK